jgi:glycosyltransferase involved in cell wall biosynthesis
MSTTQPVFDSRVAAVQHAASPALHEEKSRRSLSVLQLGLEWFPEKPGGLHRYYYELLKVLPELSVECQGLLVGTDAVATATSGRVQAFAPQSQSLIGRCRAAKRAMRASLESHHFDLVASHFALYAFPSIRSFGDLPFVSHFHGPWAAESRMEGAGWLAGWGKSRLERVVYRRADRLICLSAAFAQILERDYGVLRDRVRVIPGGIDTERFDISQTRMEARSRLGWPTARPILVCIRRLVRRMGLENLIDAAAILRRAVPDVLIYIAGRGPILGELQSRIEASGLQDTCKLLGFVPDEDLPLAYRAADLTIVPSLALEGFGLVAAESLAAGTPALVANVGGLPEVVSPLCPDLVVPSVSAGPLADSLANAVLGRLTIPSKAACMAYAQARFRWSLIAGRVRAVYDEACGRGAVRGNEA